MKIKMIFISLILIFISRNSSAGYAFTLSEAQKLPPFCLGLSVQNFEKDAQFLKKNIKVPGEHTQHFCHGMKSILREDYATAIQEFEYVQHHSTTKHALIPATSLYRAEAFGMLGKTNEALQEYNNAIKFKRKYPHAYVKLADYYLKIKQRENAIQTIKQGLKYSPDSIMLKNKLKRIEAAK